MRPWLILIVKLLSDSVFIYLSFVIAYFLKFGMFLPVGVYNRLLFFMILIWLIVFNLGGLYKFPKREGKREDNILATSFAVTSAAFITLFLIFFLYKEATYSMDVIFYAWVCSLILINASRVIIWRSCKKALDI